MRIVGLLTHARVCGIIEGTRTLRNERTTSYKFGARFVSPPADPRLELDRLIIDRQNGRQEKKTRARPTRARNQQEIKATNKTLSASAFIKTSALLRTMC